MAEPKFEKDLQRLEEVVEALEEGGLPLDDALKKFEEGVRLAKRCDEALNAAEKKIQKLTRNAKGDLEAVPFEDDTAKDDDSDDEDGDEDEEAEEDEDEGELLF